MTSQNLASLATTPPKKKLITPQRLILLTSVALAATAWLIGYFSVGTSAQLFIPDVLAGSVRVETRGDLFISYGEDGSLIGYAATGKSQGYGGPIEMLVGLNPNGDITGVKIISQRETPGFFKLIIEKDFF